MYRTLNDLRILRMAEYLEDMFEHYEEMLRDGIPEVPVRARLAVLFEGGPGHKALKQAIRELEEKTQRIYAETDTEGVLQALYECERIAHAFYVDQLDHLSDPEMVDLFKRLAAEEDAHAAAVQAAMKLYESLPAQERGLAHGPSRAPVDSAVERP